jgi:hypothetical protein
MRILDLSAASIDDMRASPPFLAPHTFCTYVPSFPIHDVSKEALP